MPFIAAQFGGSISAILIHTPGTPASAATAIEGYQMTLQGKAGGSVGTACIASFFGGLRFLHLPLFLRQFWHSWP
ncbi:MAG: tripartite tricarboxylate transporter permease [Clostridium sp.]